MTRPGVPESDGLRVLLIHSDLQGGGIETCLLTLARSLSAGAKAICYCPANHPEPEEDILSSLRDEEVGLFRIRPPMVSPLYLFRLEALVRRFAPDVVHLHGTFLGVLGGVLRLRFRRSPIFLYTQHPQHSQDARWLQHLSRYAFPRLHHIVCVSQAVRDDLLSLPGRDRLASRLSIIHNGIDLRPFRQAIPPEQRHALRAQMGAQDGDRLLGSVGLLWHIKGYHVLLPAFRRVLSHNPSARLVLVGAGEQRVALGALAEQLGIAGRTTFLGWRADVPRLLQALDLYVQPSLSEGLPMALLEASAAGLPIVATAVGGVPEIVMDGQTGLLVAPQDPEAMAEALVRLLSDPNLASTLSTNARDRARREFSAEAMAAKYMALYEELLGKAGTREGEVW